ncbi:outer membrane protein [Helicobacter mustelae]|uniref:outer membrane beta-barrel protein n=1 Tax=Helicobacter mustelae TaxID=217 RepID=UPI000E068CCE|nr:outer membrane beta-barrel protein [Helicobacter mustelae]STP11926.1 outer membrane protein [Helicobacter mustelae]
MKKILLSLLLFLGMMHLAHARFFIGSNGGFGFGFGTKSIQNLVYSSELGYQFFFEPKERVGMRVFGQLGYNNLLTSDSVIATTQPALGLDMLFEGTKEDHFFAFGVFGGIQAGINSALPMSRKALARLAGLSPSDPVPLYRLNFLIKGRIGMSFIFVEHHRVEFFALIPIAPRSINAKKDYIPQTYNFMMGYKFVF